MVDIIGQFSGVGAGFITGLKSLIYIIPIFLIAIALIMFFRNRALYRYPVRIFRIRDNGKHREVNYIGAFIKRQGLTSYFKIKTGRLWWQYMDLSTTPEVKYMDEEDRVYYQQSDVGTLQQVRRYFDKNKNVHFVPVGSNIKLAVTLAALKINSITVAEPTWKKVLPYAGMLLCAIILIIGHIVNVQYGCG